VKEWRFNRKQSMEAQTILVSDYLDILFQARNKEYGSYELRRNYTARLQTALLLIMLLCSVLVLLSMRKTTAASHTSPLIMAPVRLADLPIEMPAVPKQAAVPRPAPAAVKAPVSTPRLKVVADKAVNDLEPVVKQQPATETTGLAGNSTAGDVVSGKPGGLSNVIPPPSPIIPSASTPIRYVEQIPQFDELNQYLSTHLRYPEAAKENNIQGRVSVEFVVNEDGSISNARVLRGIGDGCDQEALRVINGMPKWKPGKQNGKAVKVYFILPIVFMLH
jgi:protein TonB